MRIGSGEAGSMTKIWGRFGGGGAQLPTRPRTEYRAHPRRVHVHRHRERARQGRERLPVKQLDHEPRPIPGEAGPTFHRVTRPRQGE